METKAYILVTSRNDHCECKQSKQKYELLKNTDPGGDGNDANLK